MQQTSLDKSKIKFLLLEGIHPSAQDVLRRAGYSQIEALPGALEGDELKRKLHDAHFVGIRSRTQLTADVLAHAPRLVAVGAFCIGTNQIDLNAARERGIAVFNAPYSNTRSVAELVLAEAILLLRGVPAGACGWPRCWPSACTTACSTVLRKPPLQSISAWSAPACRWRLLSAPVCYSANGPAAAPGSACCWPWLGCFG